MCPVKVSAHRNSETLCIFQDSDQHECAEWIDVQYLEPDAIEHLDNNVNDEPCIVTEDMKQWFESNI